MKQESLPREAVPDFTETSTGSGIWYRKSGNLVEIQVIRDNITWNDINFITLGTLPTGYRPPLSITMPGLAGVTNADTMLSTIIHRDGRIMCSPLKTGTYYARVHATFFAS